MHTAVLPADSSPGPRLKGLWAKSWQQHGSWQAARRRPDKGSERGAVRILKRQNLQQSFSPWATFSSHLCFITVSRTVNTAEKPREATRKRLQHQASLKQRLNTTWPARIDTNTRMKSYCEDGDHSKQMCKQPNLGRIIVNAFVERGTVFADGGIVKLLLSPAC